MPKPLTVDEVRQIVRDESGQIIRDFIKRNDLDMIIAAFRREHGFPTGVHTKQAKAFSLPGHTHALGRVEKEFPIPLDALGKGATKPTLVTLGNYAGYSYGINDDSIFSFEVPKDWDESTNMVVAIHYYVNEAYATASGEIQWSVAWSACPENATEAADGAKHTGTIDSGDINIPVTAKFVDEAYLGVIPAISLAQDDIVGLTLKRVALDGGSNPTAEPVIIHMEIEYISDKRGEEL